MRSVVRSRARFSDYPRIILARQKCDKVKGKILRLPEKYTGNVKFRKVKGKILVLTKEYTGKMRSVVRPRARFSDYPRNILAM